jgi:hypothetical protein
MSRKKRLLSIAVTISVIAMGGAVSAETGRIKLKPPDIAEAERIASELVMNDSLLQKGDIVVTYRGFFEYRGLAPDGFTNEFSPVPQSRPSRQAGPIGWLTGRGRLSRTFCCNAIVI